jgi:hypothetical protein
MPENGTKTVAPSQECWSVYDALEFSTVVQQSNVPFSSLMPDHATFQPIALSVVKHLNAVKANQAYNDIFQQHQTITGSSCQETLTVENSNVPTTKLTPAEKAAITRQLRKTQPKLKYQLPRSNGADENNQGKDGLKINVNAILADVKKQSSSDKQNQKGNKKSGTKGDNATSSKATSASKTKR